MKEFYKCPFCGQSYVYDLDDFGLDDDYYTCLIDCEVCHKSFKGVDTFIRCEQCDKRDVDCLSMPIILATSKKV
jgi:hypothetical protein